MAGWQAERMGPGAWERVRAIRLRALADAPDAFGSTLAEALAQPQPVWRARLADPRAATFLVGSHAGDVGLVTGAPFEERPGAAGLFGMWVAPEVRGRGVGDVLVDAVVAWARAAGHERLSLDVADTNVAAIALYARNGFVATGVTGSLPPPREHILEHERSLPLRPA
jgi:GNAT superfamily N-acetyltransferase